MVKDEAVLQDQEGLLEPSVPLMFADGTDLYKKLAEEYIAHKTGYFILGPSGVGKSHYYRNQKEGGKHWIDADRLWRWAKAMPKGAWWENPELISDVEMKCDIITHEAKKLGFWLMGSACYWLRPDAIVVPPWEKHVEFIKKRELNFDGGARSNPKELAQLQKHRQWILTWTEQGVPKFDSIEDAANYLSAKES